MTFLFYSLKQHALLTSNLVITNMHLRLKTQKGAAEMAVPSPLSIYLAKGQPLCRIRLLSTALFPSLGRNLPA